jgi:hypothetical protein
MYFVLIMFIWIFLSFGTNHLNFHYFIWGNFLWYMSALDFEHVSGMNYARKPRYHCTLFLINCAHNYTYQFEYGNTSWNVNHIITSLTRFKSVVFTSIPIPWLTGQTNICICNGQQSSVIIAADAVKYSSFFFVKI